jgi:TetR/AcrR family transcriptional regulator, transcriptional repressor for nem operon
MARMFDEALAKFERITGGKPAALALRSYVDFYLSVRHQDARDSGCPLSTLAADACKLAIRPEGG